VQTVSEHVQEEKGRKGAGDCAFALLGWVRHTNGTLRLH
jgi:hypothetical protein